MTAIELSLRSAGITVETDNLNASHFLSLYVVGSNAGRGCFGHYKMELSQAVPASTVLSGATGLVRFTPFTAVASMVADSMNDLVHTSANENTDSLALRILRARDVE